METKKRYYLMFDRSFYGVLTLLGEEVLMSTTKQNEANVFFEDEVPAQLEKLKERNIKVKKVEVMDGNLRKTRGTGVLHHILED